MGFRHMPLFLLAVFTVGSLVSDLVSSNCMPGAVWCMIFHYNLTGHVVERCQAKNQKQCWEKCKTRDDCKSSNFMIATGNCELSNAVHDEYPEHFILSSGTLYTYSESKDCHVQPTVNPSTAGRNPCITHTCLDDGSCVPSGDSYTCTACRTSFRPPYCKVLNFG